MDNEGASSYHCSFGGCGGERCRLRQDKFRVSFVVWNIASSKKPIILSKKFNNSSEDSLFFI